jgi:hypothetical protein
VAGAGAVAGTDPPAAPVADDELPNMPNPLQPLTASINATMTVRGRRPATAREVVRTIPMGLRGKAFAV